MVEGSTSGNERPTLLLLPHLVEAGDRWRRAFHADEPTLSRVAVTGHYASRFVQNPANLMVGLEFPSPEAADRFLEASDVVVMNAAGVASPSSVLGLEPVEERRYEA